MGAVTIILICVGLATAAVATRIIFRRAAQAWSVIAEGEFAGIEHVSDPYGIFDKPHLVHSAVLLPLSITRIHFKDGSSCVLRGPHHCSAQPGTTVRVMQNGVGEMRIDVAEP